MLALTASVVATFQRFKDEMGQAQVAEPPDNEERWAVQVRKGRCEQQMSE